MLSTAIFFDSMPLIMVFHLSLVAMLFAPLTFRAVNMFGAGGVGFWGFLPLLLRGFVVWWGGGGGAGTRLGTRPWLISTSWSSITWSTTVTMGSLKGWRCWLFTAKWSSCGLHRVFGFIFFLVVRLLQGLQL